MSHTSTSSDVEVYLSDPPSDLDADAKTEDDYEYHPANTDSFVDSPESVSVQLISRSGSEPDVTLHFSNLGGVAASTNGHTVEESESDSAGEPAPGAEQEESTTSCPVDVASILRQAVQATGTENGNRGAAVPQERGFAGAPPSPPPPAVKQAPVAAAATALPEEEAPKAVGAAPRGLPSLPGRPAPKKLGGLTSLPARPGPAAAPPSPSPSPAPAASDSEPDSVGSEEEEEQRPAPPASRALGGAPFLPPRAAPKPSAPAPPAPPAGPRLPPRPANGEAEGEALRQPSPAGPTTPAAPDTSRFAADMAARVQAARQAEAEAAAAVDPAEAALARAVQAFRVTTHRVAARLGVSPRASVLQQALYRLNMAERLQLPRGALGGGGPGGGDATAADEAAAAEAAGEPLAFSATVLVIGLRGTGKSATIASLLGRGPADAASAGDASAGARPAGGYCPTTSVRLERGRVAGMDFTFIDTPGLEAGSGATASNARVIRAVRRAFDAHRPHAILYVDRLDAARRDASELHALRAVSASLGAESWFSTLLCVTHALAQAPDGAAGSPLSADAYLQTRQQQLVQIMRAVAGDSRMMNPVALVENSPACARGAGGEPVLPSGVAWRRHLLMLCATTRVLNEASTLLKPDKAAQRAAAAAQQARGNPFGRGMSMKVPPMAWLLAKLVEFRAPRKYPEDEREIRADDELRDLPASEREVHLRKRRAFLRQRAEEARSEESSVPILAPEPALGPSFDPEVNNHRYRVLEAPNAMLTRPVIGEGGVDHEDGIDSVQVERSAILRRRDQFLGGVPSLAWVQVQKDKNSLTFQGEADAAVYHSSYWITSASVNAQSLQRDILYTGRLESRVCSRGKRQKLALGLLASKLGEDYTLPFKPGNAAFGLKLDERLRINDGIKLRAAIGRLLTKMGTSYEPGTVLAADLKLRSAADETARMLLGGSAQWQGRDARAARQSLVVGGNVAGEVRLPRLDGSGFKSDTQVSANVQYTTRGQGTMVLRINSHDYPQLAAALLVPVLKAAWDKCFAPEPELY